MSNTLNHVTLKLCILRQNPRRQCWTRKLCTNGIKRLQTVWMSSVEINWIWFLITKLKRCEEARVNDGITSLTTSHHLLDCSYLSETCSSLEFFPQDHRCSLVTSIFPSLIFLLLTFVSIIHAAARVNLIPLRVDAVCCKKKRARKKRGRKEGREEGRWSLHSQEASAGSLSATLPYFAPEIQELVISPGDCSTHEPEIVFLHIRPVADWLAFPSIRYSPHRPTFVLTIITWYFLSQKCPTDPEFLSHNTGWLRSWDEINPSGGKYH
ncbi:uncharacterized protein LOC111559538 isoform X3 [Felis catus]|uniref:uncharacterized protein LOC111559538 isoform X3 n=1 Tax=Felis catus TaxID=9685 RepID=UPI001D19ACA5|nr:uncharacterized protein LOC111559538 isoform X3 [Felis catus]